MPEPKFVVRNSNDDVIAGDNILDGTLKYIAAREDGYITQSNTKEVVYDARIVVPSI